MAETTTTTADDALDFAISPDQLVTLFKRQGHYDRLRRQLLERFRQAAVGRRFQEEIRDHCTLYLEQQLLSRKTEGTWPDKSTLQRRIIRDLENRVDLFDKVKRSVEERLRADCQDQGSTGDTAEKSESYGRRMMLELESIIDDPEALKEFTEFNSVARDNNSGLGGSAITSANEDLIANDSKAAKRARAAMEHNLIMGILSYAAPPPPQPAKKLKVKTSIAASSSDKSAASTVAVSDARSDEKRIVADDLKSPIEAVAAVLASSPFKTRAPAKMTDDDSRGEEENNTNDSDHDSFSHEDEMDVDKSPKLNNHAGKEDNRSEEEHRRRRNSTRRSSVDSRTNGDNNHMEMGKSPDEPPPETFAEVFLRGQKLAAWVRTDDGEKCLAVIVKSFDATTGLYTCRDPEAHRGQQDTWLLPMEKLLHFNHSNDKSFAVGNRVYSLYRSRNSGLSSQFYPGTVQGVTDHSVQVKFDDGDAATVKLNELFLSYE